MLSRPSRIVLTRSDTFGSNLKIIWIPSQSSVETVGITHKFGNVRFPLGLDPRRSLDDVVDKLQSSIQGKADRRSSSIPSRELEFAQCSGDRSPDKGVRRLRSRLYDVGDDTSWAPVTQVHCALLENVCRWWAFWLDPTSAASDDSSSENAPYIRWQAHRRVIVARSCRSIESHTIGVEVTLDAGHNCINAHRSQSYLSPRLSFKSGRLLSFISGTERRNLPPGACMNQGRRKRITTGVCANLD